MFTGLVQAVGEVVGVKRHASSMRLKVRPLPGQSFPVAQVPPPTVGDSISVAGCCLTVASASGSKSGSRSIQGEATIEFDVVAETLSKTTLGTLRVGSRVNLEHSVLPTTLMGGHIVQGHVDGVGTVLSVQTGDDWRIRITPNDPGLMSYIVPKGSVTVEGVSLTIAAIIPASESFRTSAQAKRSAKPSDRTPPLSPASFEVALIPTTLAKTTLAGLDRGDQVNLEMDVIVKTIVYQLRLVGALDLDSTAQPSLAEKNDATTAGRSKSRVSTSKSKPPGVRARSRGSRGKGRDR